MKLTLHLIDDNKLVAVATDHDLDRSQAEHLTRQLEEWNNNGRSLVIPFDCEVIDMRTPQKEQIEAIVNGMLRDYGWIGDEPDGN